MPVFDIPGVGKKEYKTLILDLNGTLSVGGEIVDGVEERLKKLVNVLGFNAVLFTGNTRGDADDIASRLGIEWRQAKTSEDKAKLAQEFQPFTAATIGNGRIDLELFQAVDLGIVTLQAEGVHRDTLHAADIIVPTINDALDLFIDPQRLIATLRK